MALSWARCCRAICGHVVKVLVPFVLATTLASPASAANYVFYNWTTTYAGGNWTWTNNTNPAGTITASSATGGWSGAIGAYTLPTPITPQSFTREFQVSPQAVGKEFIITFPAGFAWGTGGMLVIGNIRDWYAYKLQAWDTAGNPINVNNWTTPQGLLGEYLTGGSGYVATSTTAGTPSGSARIFSVSDSQADQVVAEGGVVPLLMRNASGNPDNVGKISVTLTDSTLPSGNPGGSDFLILNVATPADTGTLKICKVAGPGVAIGRMFGFTIGTATLSVPAGPAPGGTCRIGPSLLEGSNAAIVETIPPGGSVTSITAAPAGRLLSSTPANGTATVHVGSGFTDVTFTNQLPFGYLEICKQIAPSNTFPSAAGTYTFTLGGGNMGTVSVPSGSCSPAIQVPAGQVVIRELDRPGTAMTACSTIPASRQGPCILTNRTSRVTVVAGDVSTATVAFITNKALPIVIEEHRR